MAAKRHGENLNLTLILNLTQFKVRSLCYIHFKKPIVLTENMILLLHVNAVFEYISFVKHFP